MKKHKEIIYTSFDRYLTRQLKDPKFKKTYEEEGAKLEIAFQIIQLRKRRKMSQAVLARKIGMKQSNIARMESGQQNFTINMLWKIARAFKRDLKISFEK